MVAVTQIALLIWVAASITLIGVAVLDRWSQLRGLPLIGYGVAAGLVIHGLLGWAIAITPASRPITLPLLAVGLAAAVVYLLRCRRLSQLWADLPPAGRWSVAVWLLFLLECVALISIQVPLPRDLPDGLYISKADTLNVRVQYLIGLPADNYIPFAVEQFMARGVSFKKERPILPGNEVVNRTVLMSLVALPFGVAGGVQRDRPNLGTYSYIGQQWRNVWSLGDAKQFEQFEVVGMILNSLLLLGLFVVASSFAAESGALLAASLFLTSPYFVGQTIYTWPKSFAGFWILLAINSIRAGHRAWVVGALLGFAYHSHPYAMVYVAFTGLFYLVQWRRGAAPVRAVITYAVTCAVVILPWIVWTKFMLRIPSDLIAQNFAGAGTEAALASPINFIWIRFSNLYQLIAPTLLSPYPFNLAAVTSNAMYCVPGVVGILLVIPAALQFVHACRIEPLYCYILLAPAAAIVGVYSCPAINVLHGLQPLLAVLLFFGVLWLRRNLSRGWTRAIVGLQVAINLALLVGRAVAVHAHF